MGVYLIKKGVWSCTILIGDHFEHMALDRYVVRERSSMCTITSKQKTNYTVVMPILQFLGKYS